MQNLWRDLQKLWGASRLYASGIVLASVWLGIFPHVLLIRVTHFYFKLDGAIRLGIWTSDLTEFMWWTVLLSVLAAGALQFFFLQRGRAQIASRALVFSSFITALLIVVFLLTPIFGFAALLIACTVYAAKQMYLKLALPYIVMLLFLGFFANRLTYMTQRLVDGDTIFLWLFEVSSVIALLVWFSTRTQVIKMR
ncbi:MAG: hypothetical protein O3B64_02610 [bacterium]|nr:hypothetical protein [bacterium]MDA1024770.1 hypothetical protein [bacterium]